MLGEFDQKTDISISIYGWKKGEREKERVVKSSTQDSFIENGYDYRILIPPRLIDKINQARNTPLISLRFPLI